MIASGPTACEARVSRPRSGATRGPAADNCPRSRLHPRNSFVKIESVDRPLVVVRRGAIGRTAGQSGPARAEHRAQWATDPKESFMSRIIAVGGALVLTLGLIAADLGAQEPRPAGEIDFGAVIRNARAGGPRALAGPYRDFNEVTQGAKKVEGLFTLYEKGPPLCR